MHIAFIPAKNIFFSTYGHFHYARAPRMATYFYDLDFFTQTIFILKNIYTKVFGNKLATFFVSFPLNVYQRIFKITDRFNMIVVCMGKNHIRNIFRLHTLLLQCQNGTLKILHFKSRHCNAACIYQYISATEPYKKDRKKQLESACLLFRR